MENKITPISCLLNQLLNTIDITNPDIYHAIKKAEKIERRQLEAAFKAGWMRANALNYDPSYFEHFLSETYDNH